MDEIMKAYSTDIIGRKVGYSPLYNKRTGRRMEQPKAVQIFFGKEGSVRRDTLSISDAARCFSKDSIAALIDSSVNASGEQLSYYLNHYNDMNAILDAINFGENVSCGYAPDFKEYGIFSFDYNGSWQIIPNYAVPRINPGSLPQIRAVNNALVLKDKGYYSWTAANGSQFVCTVDNGRIGPALSESLLVENTNQKGKNYRWEMRKTGNILSALAQGKSLYGFNKKDILSACESVGITEGAFSIDAGNGRHNYILQESGKVINVDKQMKTACSVDRSTLHDTPKL